MCSMNKGLRSVYEQQHFALDDHKKNMNILVDDTVDVTPQQVN